MTLSSPPESDGFEQVSIKPVDTEVQGLIAKLSAQEVKGSQRRTGDLSVYQYYAKIVGWFNFLLFLSCGAQRREARKMKRKGRLLPSRREYRVCEV